MIFDFYRPAGKNFWKDRFDNDKFINLRKDERHVFQRVPCENDVEFWFVMGLYNTWKANGKDRWMKKWLPAAEKALQYDMESEYVWSEKYQLLKRPLTIDTWDFMPAMDADLVGGDVMESIPGKSRYGVMHGDNTGFAVACRMLAEMYKYNGNLNKAKHWRSVADTILTRLDKLSWNGEYYTHFIDEKENVERDMGVDMSKQVSLSNTYALNRGISHEKAEKIIETYQEIKKEKPESSPGEFYGIYPPFQKGFAINPWHYTNGGVFPFIAGELAKGSFKHGYEAYGVDILARMKKILVKSDGEFPYYYLGKIPERPETNFQTLSIQNQANVDFSGNGTKGVPGWTNQGPENDLSGMPVGEQTFNGVPFDIIDPKQNNHKACIGMALDENYKRTATIEINKKAKSLYFLHTMAGSGLAGWVDLYYADGSYHRKFIESGRQLKNWWNPADGSYSRTTGWNYKVAWSYHNGKSRVGVYNWGLNNPYPAKKITKLVFHHSRNSVKWFILGITISDQPAYFKWPRETGDHLVNWHSASLLSALIEGLAGIKDAGVAYNRVTLSPRWSVTDVEDISVTAHYPASQNYVSYQLKKMDKKFLLKLAGVAGSTDIKFLLPSDSQAKSVKVNGSEVSFNQKSINNSKYLVFNVSDMSYKNIELLIK